MFGENMLSAKKHRVAQGLKIRKKFQELAEELDIAQATAEVYGIVLQQDKMWTTR